MTSRYGSGHAGPRFGRLQAWYLVGAVTMVLSACSEPVPELPATMDSLAFDTLFSIGAPSGEAWASFEGIWDIQVDAEGRMAVLDVGGPAIHVFDTEGVRIGSLDDIGLDEGQLDGPSAIAWSETGELLVWDPGASWVSRFLVGPGGVQFADRWRAFAFGETGFCASGDRTYLSYWQDGSIIHEVGPQGIAGSFGPAPEVPGAEALGPDLLDIATEELTPSALVCTPDGIVDVGFVQSIVRLHDWGGAEIWGRDLDDLRPIRVYSDDGIGLGRAFDSSQGSHLLRSAVSWGSGFVLVQHDVRRQEIPGPGEIEVLESRLLSLVDGSEIGRSRTMPRVLAAQGRRLFLVSDAPHPVVTVVAVR